MTEDRKALLRLMHQHAQLKVLMLLMLRVLPVPQPERETLLRHLRQRLEELDQGPAQALPDAALDNSTLLLLRDVALALGPRD